MNLKRGWLFSQTKSIGVADSNLAEFLAIWKAFLIFSFSNWKNIYGLIVESDSFNAVLWFNNQD
ncbi:hypothetical protein REPUB_Repub07fG0066600 [Reevesia pubescens]